MDLQFLKLRILLGFAFCAIASAPLRSQSTEAPSPSKAEKGASETNKSDPVELFKSMAKSISSEKPIKVPKNEYMQYGYDEDLATECALVDQFFEVKSIDVRKTDSLISPLIGLMEVNKKFALRGSWSTYRLTFVWQEGRWVIKKLEFTDRGGWTRETVVKHPDVRVWRRVFPKAEWQME